MRHYNHFMKIRCGICDETLDYNRSRTKLGYKVKHAFSPNDGFRNKSHHLRMSSDFPGYIIITGIF